ncbi:hypothetical protein CEXT_625331, partial [Caerostris extrusa]
MKDPHSIRDLFSVWELDWGRRVHLNEKSLPPGASCTPPKASRSSPEAALRKVTASLSSSSSTSITVLFGLNGCCTYFITDSLFV